MSTEVKQFKTINSKTAIGLSQKNIVEWVFQTAREGELRSIADVFSKKAVIDLASADRKDFTPKFKSYLWKNHDFAAFAFLDDGFPVENPRLSKQEMENL